MAELTPEELKAMGFTVPGDEPTAAELAPEDLAAMGMADVPQMPPPPKNVDPSRWEAAWRTFLAGVYKQGSDEAAGLVTEAKAPVGAGLRMPDGSVRLLKKSNDAYRAGRDSERAMLKASEEKFPVQSFLTNVAGDIASDAALRATGLPVLSTGYQAAVGGLSGLLGGEAELTSDKRTSGDMARAAIDTGVGAGLGAVVPKVAQGAGRVMGPLLRKVRAGLEAGAVGLGRRVLQGGSDLAGARFKEVPSEAIREALSSGAIVPFGTTQGAFTRLKDLAEARGIDYAGLLKRLEDMGFSGPEVVPLVEEMLASAAERGRTTVTSKAPARVFRRAADSLDNIARGGDDVTRGVGPAVESIPLTQADIIKRTAQKEAKYGLLQDTPENEAKQEVASKVRQAIEDAIEKQGAQFPVGAEERELAEAFVPVKRQLARTIAARNLAEKGNTRVSGRNTVGLREALMGAMLSGGGVAAGGAPVESLVGGLGTAAALSMAGRRLPSTGASALYQGSRGARALAEGAARNPQAAGLPVAKGVADLSREQLSALIDYLEGPRRKKEKKQ